MKKKLTDAEFKKRTQELLLKESAEPYQWHYCSFATDDGFRGLVILQAHGIVECAIRARSLNANPGGQLMAVAMPDEIIAQVPETHRNRLLTKAEVQEIWPESKSLREYEEEEANAATPNS